MYTWGLILVFIMLVLAAGSVILMRRSGYKSMQPLLLLLIAAIIAGGVWLTAQNHMENAVIGNAQAVMKWDKCPSETDRVIYYDEEENSYFFVTYENWEFAPLFKRNYLDTVRAAELVDLHSQIESYTLDDLFISK